MNVATGKHSWITRLAVARDLPYKTVRARLTLLYGGLFLISGAALMAIAYTLLVNAGFVFAIQPNTGQNRPAHNPATSPLGSTKASSAAGGGALPQPSPGFGAGVKTHPSENTLAYWRGVASCMRRHGIAAFPEPRTSYPSHLTGDFVSDRNGAILVFPSKVPINSPQYERASAVCGLMYDSRQQQTRDTQTTTRARQQLLIQSGIALAGTLLLSLGLGWLMAGRMLQPLEDTYRAQSQFVSNASHELRAPLTRLRMLSEVALASPQANAATLGRAHERVLASEQELERLIDSLLALTRGQAGLESNTRLDLAALTSNVLATQAASLAGLDVTTALGPAVTTGDPRLAERLVTNLVDNAARHNTPRGQIEVVTGIRDRRAFFAITNTGPTVPPDELERLFRPFQRVGTARIHHDDGHGLGLSIVSAIADAHHARVDAQAKPDGGLAITVTFRPSTHAGRWLTPRSVWTPHPRGTPRSDAGMTGSR